jgi:hypothetical protein
MEEADQSHWVVQYILVAGAPSTTARVRQVRVWILKLNISVVKQDKERGYYLLPEGTSGVWVSDTISYALEGLASSTLSEPMQSDFLGPI